MLWIKNEVNDVFDRLEAVEARYEKLNELLSDPEIVNNPSKLREYSKEQSDIQRRKRTVIGSENNA
jgi:peptide chain release factor 1